MGSRSIRYFPVKEDSDSLRVADQIAQLSYLSSASALNSMFMATAVALSAPELRGRVNFITMSQAHLFCQQTRVVLKPLGKSQGICYKHSNVLSGEVF